MKIIVVVAVPSAQKTIYGGFVGLYSGFAGLFLLSWNEVIFIPILVCKYIIKTNMAEYLECTNRKILAK